MTLAVLAIVAALAAVWAGYERARWQAEHDRRGWLETRLMTAERQRDEAIQRGQFTVAPEPELPTPGLPPLPKEMQAFIDGFDDPASRADSEEYVRMRLEQDPSLSLDLLRSELLP